MKQQIVISYPAIRRGTMAILAADEEVAALGQGELGRLNRELVLLAGCGIAFNLVLSAALAYVLSSDIVQRVELIKHNARLLAQEEPLQPLQQGTDEIAELDRILHDSAQTLNQLRQKQSVILSNVSDVLCSLTKTLKLARASKVLEKAWLYSNDELRGRSILSLLAPDAQAKARKEFFDLIGSQKTREIETVVRCKNGVEKNTIWRVNWSESKKAFFCFVHDVTAIRSVQHFRRRFLSMVSHDLRSPLTSVSISLSMLEDGECGALPAAALTQVRQMKAEVSTVAQLVNEFLALEKVVSGKMSYKSQCVSVFDVCEEARELIEPLARAANVEVCSADGEGEVAGDEQALIDCTAMILRSSIRRSDAGAQVRIHVLKQKGHVITQVIDNGARLTQTQRDALLREPNLALMREAVITETSWFDLIKVRAVIEALKGQFGIENIPSVGTVFSLTLPEFRDEELPGT